MTNSSPNKVGRPRYETNLQKRRNISLDNKRAIKIKKLFGGNLSESIRAMIDEYET